MSAVILLVLVFSIFTNFKHVVHWETSKGPPLLHHKRRVEPMVHLLVLLFARHVGGHLKLFQFVSFFNAVSLRIEIVKLGLPPSHLQLNALVG
jgi:hypothetical protein